MCLVCLRNLAKQHLFQHLQLVPLYSTLQLYGFPAALSYNVANGLVTVSTWDSIGCTLHKKSTTWTSLLPQPLPYPSIFKQTAKGPSGTNTHGNGTEPKEALMKPSQNRSIEHACMLYDMMLWNVLHQSPYIFIESSSSSYHHPLCHVFQCRLW